MIATLVEPGLSMYFGMAALFKLSDPYVGADYLVVNIMGGPGCEDCENSCEVYATDERGTVLGASVETLWSTTDPQVSYESALVAIGYELVDRWET